MTKTKHFARPKLYSEQEIVKCIHDIKNNNVPVSTACKKHSIPRSTIKFRLSNKWKKQKKSGPDTILSTNEEEELSSWVKRMAKKGFPVTRHKLMNRVVAFLKANPKNPGFKNVTPSKFLFIFYLEDKSNFE